MAEIDWHDFIVAETITFTEEDENVYDKYRKNQFISMVFHDSADRTC